MSLRALVADDEKLSADLLAESVRDLGFKEVAVVYTPEAAIEHIEANKPDLVFLDINFNMDTTGMDVMRRVVKSTPESSICLMSGYRDDCRAEGVALGAIAFIGKPSMMEDYVAVAAAFLKARTPQG